MLMPLVWRAPLFSADTAPAQWVVVDTEKQVFVLGRSVLLTRDGTEPPGG